MRILTSKSNNKTIDINFFNNIKIKIYFRASYQFQVLFACSFQIFQTHLIESILIVGSDLRVILWRKLYLE